VIVFLVGYVKSVTDSNYPVTGTFGIEGQKVSYKLDKVCFDKISYKNIIINDIKGITAKVLLIKDGEQTEIPYKEIARGLEVEIPKLKPGEKIDYKLQISYKHQTYNIPESEYITLTFWGNIPSLVSILNFILMYGGLLMAIRCLLESTTKKSNLKKFIVITCALFITLVIIVYPLYNTYKLGAINNFVPPFYELVNPLLIIILGAWTISAILIFNNKFSIAATIFSTVVTFLIYFLF